MKVGIITMHNVLNYGSALQTYALQQALNIIGYDNEIIDYKFQSEKKQKITINSLLINLVNQLKNAILGFPLQKKKKKFNLFYIENLNISGTSYLPSTIMLNPPIYDIYMVGSDQVWNPKHIEGDSNFLLSFAPDDKPKVSYASSFATSELPSDQQQMYKECLLRFNKLSVREESGQVLISKLINKDAFIACDPTVLLPIEYWLKIADQSKLILPEKYILVYELNYMFDPYPEIVRIIDKVQELLGLHVIYLDGRKEFAFKNNSTLIKSAGPSDFIKLIKDSTFVITTSFHGTVFSSIFEKPMYCVVDKHSTSDSRIHSYLTQIGCEHSIISYNQEVLDNRETLLKKKADYKLIKSYRDCSWTFLRDMLYNEDKK